MRRRDAATPIWIGESEEDDDGKAPSTRRSRWRQGSNEFAVYARPLLLGTGRVATLSSKWTYDVSFEAD